MGQAHASAPYLTARCIATGGPLNATYVDIGLNLGHRRFDRDREAVVDRAVALGVTRMVLTGTNLAESMAMATLATTRPDTLWSTAGIHPHDAANADANALSDLRRLAGREPVVAVGECGLDFNRDFSPRPVQEAWFERQLALACELKLPVFLHERDATERMIAILDRYIADLPGGVIHCFTGDEDALKAYLERGLFVGITGWICDERRGEPLKALVHQIPPERLLLETDAPYLPPRDMQPRPKRNEPAFLPHIATAVAHAMGMPLETVARISTANALRLFGLRRSIPEPTEV